MKKSNPLHDARTLFTGHRFSVCAVGVQTEKGSVAYEGVVHPGAVVILPLLSEDKVVIIRNHRHLLGEWLWELPAGTLEVGEAPLEAAKREITEETGYLAKEIKPLLNFYSTPGFCTEMLYAFVARQLVAGSQKLDATEEIEIKILSWDRINSMLRHGEIRDSKTLTTLLYYTQVANTG